MKFPRDVLNPRPREASDFPKMTVCPTYWTLCSPQNGVVYNYNLSSLPCSGSHDTKGRTFWPWQHLWCRWTVIHIIHWLTFHIQCLVSVVQRHMGKQGGQGGGSPATPSMDLPPFPSSPLSCYLRSGTERIQDPPDLRFFFWWCSRFYLREGRAWFHQSISFSDSLMLLNLSTSSRSSATRLSRSSTQSHLTPLFSPLTSVTRERLWHSLQPETWMAACFRGSSVWVATSILVSAEDTAFCRVDTTAKLLLKGWWPPTELTSRARSVTAPFLHALPPRWGPHALCACSVGSAPGHLFPSGCFHRHGGCCGCSGNAQNSSASPMRTIWLWILCIKVQTNKTTVNFSALWRLRRTRAIKLPIYCFWYSLCIDHLIVIEAFNNHYPYVIYKKYLNIGSSHGCDLHIRNNYSICKHYVLMALVLI